MSNVRRRSPQPHMFTTAMTNSALKAAEWVEFLARRPEFPSPERLRASFLAGNITRLCDCGCNTFDIEVPESTEVAALASSGSFGSFFEINFEATAPSGPVENGSIELIVFVDKRGHLAAVEVDFCGNSYPVPEHLIIKDHPYHVSRANQADA